MFISRVIEMFIIRCAEFSYRDCILFDLFNTFLTCLLSLVISLPEPENCHLILQNVLLITTATWIFFRATKLLDVCVLNGVLFD
jgi:hypothetical protein